MRKRVRGHLYFLHDFKYINGDFQRVESADGTLLSKNYGRTKLYASELPEWFVYGRYYKRFGYLSTKGITALKYKPNIHTNHFLKDDCLMISYGKTESELEDENKYDIWIWGSEILDILQGANIYSNYDIEPIVTQIKEKEEWLRKTYPDEFSFEKWEFNLAEAMQQPFRNGLPSRYNAITIDSSVKCGAIETLYGSEQKLMKFMESLPNEVRVTRELQFIKESFGYINGFELQYIDSKGEGYDLSYYSGLLTQIILRDADRFLLCSTAEIMRFKYRKVGSIDWVEIKAVDENQVVAIVKDDGKEVTLQAFIEVDSFASATEAVSAMKAVKPSVEAVLKYIFEVREDAR